MENRSYIILDLYFLSPIIAHYLKFFLINLLYRKYVPHFTIRQFYPFILFYPFSSSKELIVFYCLYKRNRFFVKKGEWRRYFFLFLGNSTQLSEITFRNIIRFSKFIGRFISLLIRLRWSELATRSWFEK